MSCLKKAAFFMRLGIKFPKSCNFSGMKSAKVVKIVQIKM